MGRPRKFKTKKMYTEKDIETVIDQWKDKSKSEIATELGIKPQQVSYLASQIKKAGVNLIQKRHVGVLRSMIEGVAKRKKLIK